jgi:hypothetical protein
MEGAGRLTGEPRVLRDGYIEALQRYLAFIKRTCSSNHMDYAAVSTSDNLGAALGRFLAHRLSFGRTAGNRR